jgi:glycosyltransferase involved in cell wall biosynthesis
MSPRVLHVIDSMHGGGAERVLLTVIRGLAAQGWAQGLSLLHDGGPLLAMVPPGVTVFKGTGSADFDVRSFAPDVIHSWVDDGLIRVAPVAAARGLPLVHRIPNIPSAQYGIHPRGGRHLRLTGHALRSCTRVIALSDAAADDTEQFFAVPRPAVIYNGYPLAGARHGGSPRPEWPAGRIRVFAAGRLAHEKGHGCLIDAMRLVVSRNSAVHCRIAGIGPLESVLTRQIEALDLTDHVELIGFHEDVPALVRDADLFVMPSLYEGFGNALAEAMLEGRAVVASDLQVFRRDVMQGQPAARFFPANDAAALASAIVELAGSQATRVELGERARKAGARFTVTRMVADFANLYEQLRTHAA